MFVTNVANQEEPLIMPKLFDDETEQDDDGSNVMREVQTGKETPLQVPSWETAK